MKPTTANLLQIESTTIGKFPGDVTGDSIIATASGSAEKGETAQVFGQAGLITNPSKNNVGLRINKGSLDIIIGTMNYTIPLPANQGETLLYSTDEDGAIKGKCYIDDQGVFTFNDGTKEAARNGDKVTVTIPTGTFIVSVSGGSGSPAVGVLNPSPIDVDGTIKEGTSEVLFP